MSKTKMKIRDMFIKIVLIMLMLVALGYSSFVSLAAALEDVSWKEKIQNKEKTQFKQFNEDLKALRKRNPFNPPSAPFNEPALAPTFVLTGIIWYEEKPAAIINDMIVSEGDVISERGIKVKKITENSVILVEKDKEYTLRLKFDLDEGTTQIHTDNAFKAH